MKRTGRIGWIGFSMLIAFMLLLFIGSACFSDLRAWEQSKSRREGVQGLGNPELSKNSRLADLAQKSTSKGARKPAGSTKSKGRSALTGSTHGDVASAASGLEAAPWPMFHGNIKHNGQSTYAGFPAPLQKWRYSTTDVVYSSPAVSSTGTIYFGSKNKYLYAMQANGDLKWSYPTGGSIYSSPAIGSDGTVYFGSDDGYLYALKADGSFEWRYATGSPVRSSPAIALDGTIYVGAQDDRLHAIDPSGNQLWQYSASLDIDTSPAIGPDGTIYVGSDDQYLHAINPDGSFKWSYKTGSYVTSSPAIGADGTIYIGSEDTFLHAVSPDGTFKWSYKTGSFISSSPAIALDGTIYVGSQDSYLYAVNPNGTLKWSYKTGAHISSSPAIGGDGVVYFGSSDRYLYAVESGGALVWRYQAGTVVSSSPAIGADGTIYVGCEGGHLYAIGVPEEKGLLYGKVTDLSTGSPIASAAVTAGGQTAQSGTDGRYQISLDPGVYDVTCTKSGYQALTRPNVVVSTGKATELNIAVTTPGILNIVTRTLPPGEVGIPYNSRIYISGGTWPYVYSVESGALPPGLKLDPAYGNIWGTPTAAGTYSFTIAVRDALSTYAARDFTIEITEPVRIITASPLPRGTRSTAYFVNIEATGGTRPYTFVRNSGSLPEGMSLSADGKLSGTPAANGSYQFSALVTDDKGRTDEKAFQLSIDEPLLFATTELNDGIVGKAYNQQLSATGGLGAYHWEVYAGILPAGLSLDGASGNLSGTPKEATYGTIVFSVGDDGGHLTYQDFILRIGNPLQISTTSLPDALIDHPYSEAIQVTGGLQPIRFSTSQQVPAGLSLDPNTGILSGVPTEGAVSNFSVTVSDSTYPSSQADTQILSIRVGNQLTITSSANLPNAKKGVRISPIVLSAKGGPSPFVWMLADGYMPEGIMLDQATGEISGAPLDKGDFIFTLQVKDANGSTAQKRFSWHVSGDLFIVTGAIPDGAKDVSYSFALEAKGGIAPYSWRIVSGTLPTGLRFNGATGTIYGAPTERATYSITVEVSDADSPAQVSPQKTYVIEVLDVLYIYTKKIPNPRLNEAYVARIEARQGNPPYSWRHSDGILPPGLTLVSSPINASLEGTPTTPGIYVFSLEVSDTATPVNRVARQFTVEVYGTVKIETTALKDATMGVAYSDDIVVSGGELPYRFTVSEGSPPAGLTLNSESGHLSGATILQTGQSSTFKVRVTDSGTTSGSDEKAFTIFVIEPLSIITATVQKGMQKSDYRSVLEAQGGVQPYTWSRDAGDFPQGVELDSGTGVISGIPVQCGVFDYTARVQDSSHNVATRAYRMEVVCSNDYQISGTVSVVEGVLMTLNGDKSLTTTTVSQGVYRFEHLPSGSYVISPSKGGYTFDPVSKAVTVSNEDVSGVDFNSTQYQPTDAQFQGNPLTGLDKAEVHFTDLSTGTISGWLWNFGDGGTSTDRNPVHTYAAPGSYTVSLTATGPQGSDTETKADYIKIGNSPPVAGFTADRTSGNAPLTATFTNTSTGVVETWSWDFGDGGTSTDKNPSHTYTAAGTYSVKLTVTGPGGTDDEIKVGYVAVYSTPTAGFSASPTSGCKPLAVTFADGSVGEISSYTWDFGDGGTSTERGPTHTYVEQGAYTVKLVTTGPGGTDEEVKTGYITVLDAPRAAFSVSSTSGAIPLTVAFTNESTGEISSFSWDFGDGTTSSEKNPAHAYSAPGTFSVKLTATGPCGSDEEIKVGLINIHAPPVADFSASPTAGAKPLAVQFTDSSTGVIDTLLWDFGDGGTSADTNPTHTYTTVGHYTVKLTVTGPGGTDDEIKTGLITIIRSTFSVSGQCSYYSNSEPVSGVSLSLSGAAGSLAGTSDTNGNYLLGEATSGSYALTPSKSDQAGSAISAMDASVILQAVVELVSLTPLQNLAADVNGSKSISAMDASLILQKVVGLIDLPFPGSSGIWAFDPVNRSYESLSSDQQGQDFKGILIGDVNGNWSGTAGSAPGKTPRKQSGAERIKGNTGLTGSARMFLGKAEKLPDGAFRIPLNALVRRGELTAGEMTFSYDAKKYQLEGVKAGVLAGQALFAANTDQPGRIRIAFASAEGLSGSGELLSFSFKAKSGRGNVVAPVVTIKEASLNDDNMKAQWGK